MDGRLRSNLYPPGGIIARPWRAPDGQLTSNRTRDHISDTVIFMARCSTCLGLSLCLALTVASALSAFSLTFHCDATESTNAVYHVACLAGQIPCTKDAFE